MKITKHGKTGETKKFVCGNCGCEFEAEKDEYWTDRNNYLCSVPPQYTTYTCCPECKKVVSSSRTTVEGYKITLTGDEINTSLNVKGCDIVDRYAKGLNNKP